MKTSTGRSGILLSLVAAFLSTACLSGCRQTTIGGQTLPSPDYMLDDVQYFPHGPENKLHNATESYRKYSAEQQRLDALR